MSRPSPSYDVAIIGAGLVGLATALALARRHPARRVIVLEKEAEPGRHQSGHNSGVIHSGIVYAPGSAKARLCVQGAEALRSFCDAHGVAHRTCGKVVVAVEEREIPALRELAERGRANGVLGLELIGPERLAELEPHVVGVAALHVPITGVVDFGAVAGAYARALVAAGGELRTGVEWQAVRRAPGTIVLETSAGEVEAARVVNCAGLHADRVAAKLGARPDVRIVPFRGEYCELIPERSHLVRHIVYPVADPRFPFLGAHLTRSLGGTVEVGPNAVLAWSREGYRRGSFALRDAAVTLAWPGFWRLAARLARTGAAQLGRSWSRGAFARALQRLVPEIRAEDLRPGGTGVRAQAVDRAGRLLDDFHVLTSRDAVHVLNAPSPAATASLAIGTHVAQIAERTFGWCAEPERPATST